MKGSKRIHKAKVLNGLNGQKENKGRTVKQKHFFLRMAGQQSAFKRPVHANQSIHRSRQVAPSDSETSKLCLASSGHGCNDITMTESTDVTPEVSDFIKNNQSAPTVKTFLDLNTEYWTKEKSS
jgi:hypothetical protein